jgi:hypothetical protein
MKTVASHIWVLATYLIKPMTKFRLVIFIGVFSNEMTTLIIEKAI